MESLVPLATRTALHQIPPVQPTTDPEARKAVLMRIHLPTALLTRYRAVDREVVGSAIVDTPAHLDALTESIRANGILVPLRLSFNDRVGFLDGNHRLAAALRLGLTEVPVEPVRVPPEFHPAHARPMRSEDLRTILEHQESKVPDLRSDGPAEHRCRRPIWSPHGPSRCR